MLKIHLQIIGYLLISLALIHVIFPKYFKWKEDLKPLSLINRQMMNVHTFFVAFVVLLMGLLCVTSFSELINTSLGKRIALGFSFFWGVRALFQFFVYSSKLWRGKTFETIAHIVFSIFWIYLTVIFWMVFKGEPLF